MRGAPNDRAASYTPARLALITAVGPPDWPTRTFPIPFVIISLPTFPFGCYIIQTEGPPDADLPSIVSDFRPGRNIPPPGRVF